MCVCVYIYIYIYIYIYCNSLSAFCLFMLSVRYLCRRQREISLRLTCISVFTGICLCKLPFNEKCGSVGSLKSSL